MHNVHNWIFFKHINKRKQARTTQEAKHIADLLPSYEPWNHTFNFHGLFIINLF